MQGAEITANSLAVLARDGDSWEVREGHGSNTVFVISLAASC